MTNIQMKQDQSNFADIVKNIITDDEINEN